MRTLRTVLLRFTEDRVDVGQRDIQNLTIDVGHFERHVGVHVPIETLEPRHVIKMMRGVLSLGRNPRTANNCRTSVLRMWRHAVRLGWAPKFDYRDIPRLREHPPRVTAWHADEMASIIESCRRAPTKRGWGPNEWLGTVLTIYDSSERIRALRLSDLSQLDVKRRTLYVPGEFRKGGESALHRLDPETVGALLRMHRQPGDTRLLPWPFCASELWRKFKAQILKPAGLPATHRDCFHKFRRTSYTLVYITHGAKAASKHATHKSDLSRYYLDESFLDEPNPLDALPRPGEPQ